MPRLPGGFQKAGSFINRHSGLWMLLFTAAFLTRYCEEKLAPVYQITAQGVALLKMYRLDQPEGGQAWQPPS